MQGTFTGKVAFVTGAGTGIGRATAVAFAKEGAKVALVGLETKDLEETHALIEGEKGESVVIAADTSKSDEVQAALQKTIDAFGQLDIAFNNAGVEQHKAPLAELPDEEWDRIVNIDLRGTYLCMKHEIPLLLKQGGGAIVNTSSGAGLIGVKANAAYTAAKHGIVGLTRSAALDYAALRHPHQRSLSWLHRDTHDGSLRQNTRGGRKGGAGRTDRSPGQAGRDCRCCAVVVFGRCLVRDRSRPCCRWWTSYPLVARDRLSSESVGELRLVDASLAVKRTVA